MPTLSFKDRGAVLLAALAARLRPDRVIADSSGNAGTAIAAYCARARLALHRVRPRGDVGQEAGADHRARRPARGGRGRSRGDRDRGAGRGRRGRVFYASHVHNPYFLHGTKTYVHELWEDLGGRLPDVLVVPVGNGTLLLGAALAVAELHTAGSSTGGPRCTPSRPPRWRRSRRRGGPGRTIWSA